MLSRIRKENQNIYINNEKVLGVQSFNASYAAPIEQVKSLGMDTVTYYNNQNTLAEINISKLLIDKDQFVKFLDYEQGFSGHIDYKNKYFAFNSGVLTRYNLSCAVGEIPQVTLDISAIGDFGSSIEKADSESLTTPDIDITDYSNIQINLDDFNFNRLQSFTLNISAEKNIIYALGSAYPKQIIVVPPILAEIEFSIKADDYSLQNIRDLICKYKVENFQIIFNKFKNPEEELFRFSFSEALFVGESFSASADASADVKIKYHAFIYNKRNPPISSPLPLINATNENLQEPGQTNSQQLPIGDASSVFPNTEASVTSSDKLFKGDTFISSPQEENNISAQINLKSGDTQDFFPKVESGIFQGSLLSQTGQVVTGFAGKEGQIYEAFKLIGKYEVSNSFPNIESSISSQLKLKSGDTQDFFPKVESGIFQGSLLSQTGQVVTGFAGKEGQIYEAFKLIGKYEVSNSFPNIESSISSQLKLKSGDTQDFFPKIESGIFEESILFREGEVVTGFAGKEGQIYEAFNLPAIYEASKSFPNLETYIDNSTKIPKDPKD